ncbi:MAG: M16 family metallopeptidase [Alphaproteobacteria bacterium]
MRRALVKTFLVIGLVIGLVRPAWAAPGVDIREVVSATGIRAWLVTDSSVPVISVKIAFRGGAAADPPGKAGLADMATGLLTEGAGEMDSQAFSRRLEDLSVGLSFGAGMDRVTGSLSTLTENRADAFDLLRLALTEARFDQDAVDRVRRQILSHLSAKSQNPRAIAGRRWFAAVFGDHPYGRPREGTEESVAAITVAELRDFVRRRLARDNLIVSVVGDIEAEELRPLLDAAFAGLPARAAAFDIAEATPRAKGTIVVPLDVPQSVVVFGQKGIARDDPDFYAAFLMNRILGGGGFTSRLSREIREKRGLAYSVYSALVPRRHAALIVGGVATANARVGDSLDLVRREWRRMRDDGVTEADLADAKAYTIGSYPLRFTSTGGIASMLTGIQFQGLGIDYIERRNGLIAAVSAADIGRVAKRLLDPDSLTIVVVGRPEGVEPG